MEPKRRFERSLEGNFLYTNAMAARTFGAKVETPLIADFRGIEREAAPIEDEVVVLDVDKGTLVRDLEAKGGVVSFDGTITDYYYELPGDTARERIGDWPRIRVKEQDGKQQFEFTIKGVRELTESGGKKSSEETIIAESFRDAERLMKDYLRDVIKLSDTEITGAYPFHTITKKRTSVAMGDDISVDVDTWLHHRVAVRNEDGSERIIEERFNEPGGKRFPTYAEFEVVYPNPDIGPEAARYAKSVIAKRDQLISDMGYAPSSVVRMIDILHHHGIQGAEEIRDEMKRNHTKAA